MNPGEHREARSAGGPWTGPDEHRDRRSAGGPWTGPGEHRDRRSAPLARRDEGPIATALLVRGATQSAAAQRGCSAGRMPSGSCSRAAPLARRDEGPIATALLVRGATQSAAAQRGCSAGRMPSGSCSRAAPLARRDEAVRGCARASTERGEAPGWQGALRGAWRSHSPKQQRRARRSSTDAAPLECRQGAFCGPHGLVAALPARGATKSAAVQRGCSAPRMPSGLCPRTPRG